MEWPAHSLRGTLQSPWLELVLVLAAVVCGTIVGMERERHDKPAGLRTLVLICLGSTIFTMVSFTFTTSTGDSGRVAAQIVTGVGFLGAGAILHSRTSVSGMTTAAAIWVMAAIGIVIGVGRPLTALGFAAVTRLVLAGVRRWEIRHLGGLKCAVVEIVFDPDHGKTEMRLDCLRENFHLTHAPEIEPIPGQSTMRGRLRIELPRRHLHEFLSELVDIAGVLEVRQLPAGGSTPNSAAR
jgi:putative Mg2+ transporter-C (MgtC) family protein